MLIYFGGAEIGTHRTLLHELGADAVSLSYMGLRRRVKFVRPWKIAEKFAPEVSVFLDSGAYTVNTDSEMTEDEIEEIYEHYKQFVLDNIDAVDMVSEFDAMVMGQEWIERERAQFWDSLPREKVMVIWHPAWGTGKLLEMAEDYEIIGIPAVSLEGRNLTPVLNALAAKGTRLHGVAMTKIDAMQTIRWASVASTSWVSPQRFGDTIVWTGKELKRYPKKMKDQARRQHRMLFERNGFDPNKIANDEGNEVLRLSVWSWKKFEEYVNKHHKPDNVVTNLFSDGPPPLAQTEEEGVDTPAPEASKEVSTPDRKGVVTTTRDTKSLPIMGLVSSRPDEDDDEDSDAVPLVNIRSESARVCDTCYLANNCPAYDPGSNCAYNIPITVATREQRAALQYGLLTMQAQRVMFMKFAEDREGGYADPNLSKEMNLLNKMMAATAEMEREGFSLSVNVQGQGQAAEGGMFSRIFGRDVGQQVQQIEPQRADDIIEATILSDDVEQEPR